MGGGSKAGKKRKHRRGSKATRIRRIAGALLPLAGVLLLALIMQAAGAGRMPDAGIVAEVNGDPIPAAQFRKAAQLHRAAVANEFVRAYGAEADGAFWTTAYGGQTPAERLKELTLEGLVRSTVVRQLAREHGIEADMDYDSFLEAWQAENERRRKAFSNGAVLYGPVQYSEADYEVYVLNNLELALEKAWTRKRPIGEVRDHASAELARETFRDWLDSRVRDAVVEVNEKIFGRLQVHGG